MVFTCQGCGCVGVGRPQRRYCSNACQRADEREQHIVAWLQSGIARVDGSRGHYVRTYLYEDQAGLCALCGGPDTWSGARLAFILDHIDGDSDNNRRENLRLVCPNCDSQLPTYKSRNRGRGRAARRARYAAGKSY